MSQRLQGKIAVVTGSGQNIGRAIAMELARQGAKVVTNSRTPGNAAGTASDAAQEIKALGGDATAVFADVSTTAGAKQVMAACLEAYGGIDILVNNAGWGQVQAMPEVTDEGWEMDMRINLNSQFACTRAALPAMMASKRGRIVNLGSRVALNGTFGMAGYAAAKAGVIGFTLVLAREMAQHGITVNCVMPTATTPKVEAHRRSRAVLTGVYQEPSKKHMPEHIAPLVAYLATDDAAKVTGQLFHITGGDITHFSFGEVKRMLMKDGMWSVEELVTAIPAHLGPDLGLKAATVPPSAT